MANKILVAYASRTGSTEGVAHAIGETLSEDGFHVNVIAMKDVKDLSEYNAVVAGSAIQAGKWLPEAIDFISSHKSALNKVPFATFQVCMTLAMPKADSYREFVKDWANPVRLMVKPKYEGSFAGVLDIKNVKTFGDRIKFRLSVLFGVWKEGDHRNWEEIRGWTKGLEKIILS